MSSIIMRFGSVAVIPSDSCCPFYCYAFINVLFDQLIVYCFVVADCCISDSLLFKYASLWKDSLRFFCWSVLIKRRVDCSLIVDFTVIFAIKNRQKKLLKLYGSWQDASSHYDCDLSSDLLRSTQELWLCFRGIMGCYSLADLKILAAMETSTWCLFGWWRIVSPVPQISCFVNEASTSVWSDE